MNRHVWTEVGGPYKGPRVIHIVKCEPCGLLASRIGDEYVSCDIGLDGRFIPGADGEILRFKDGVPRISPDDECERVMPVGTVVYHRSTQSWCTFEPSLGKSGETCHFIILAAQQGVVIDDQGRVVSTSDEGQEVRLLLEPYEFGRFWSTTKPVSVWERLRSR